MAGDLYLLTHFVSVDLETQHDARIRYGVIAAMAQCIENGVARELLGKHSRPCGWLSFVRVRSPDEPRLPTAAQETTDGLLYIDAVCLPFIVDSLPHQKYCLLLMEYHVA